MRHSVNELTDVVYRYYPRGLLSNENCYNEADEYLRLVAARRQAGADNELWRAMLQRLGSNFPQAKVQNRSLHLPTGDWDACYSAFLYLPTAPGEHNHAVGFFVSFLVPYYIVYSSRTVEDLEKIEEMKARRAKPSPTITALSPYLPNTMFVLPDWMAKMLPSRAVVPDPPIQAHRTDIGFDFSRDEQPFASWIAQDIEATWAGYERMPPEVGRVIVPDVATNHRLLGNATLYDCLFSDNW